MAISFDYYRLFYIVAKHGNFTSAAKSLFITQPTVTHTIQVLEQELSCRLFIRSQKGVTLTPEGKLLYEKVSKACQQLLEAENTIASAKELTLGSISIGASETTLHHFLMPYLAHFRKKYPHIKLKISNSCTPVTIANLCSGNMDFAVLVLPQEYHNPSLTVTKLTDFQDIAIAGNNYYALSQKSVSLKLLTNYPLVSMEKGTITRTFFEEIFSKYHTIFQPDIELATADLIVPIVENGLGIGFVPELFAYEAMKSHKIIQLKLVETIPKREICLVHKKSTPLSFAAETFISILKNDSNNPIRFH